MQDTATLPELVGDIGSAIEESGAVRESASDEVRRARIRVRTIEGRIRGILKVGGWAGEGGDEACWSVPFCPSRRQAALTLGPCWRRDV